MTEEGKRFTIGQPSVLREGTDVAVCATGYMVGLALQAAEALEGELSVKVIDVSTIKPMDPEVIRRAIGSCRAVVTAEDHSIVGGLGSAIAEALCEDPKPMAVVGMKEAVGCSGRTYQEVLAYHGLTAEKIVDAVRKLQRSY